MADESAYCRTAELVVLVGEQDELVSHFRRS